jgi:hypothetical protein
MYKTCIWGNQKNVKGDFPRNVKFQGHERFEHPLCNAVSCYLDISTNLAETSTKTHVFHYECLYKKQSIGSW